MQPTDLIIGGVSLTLVILGLVQAFKEAGLPSRLAPLAAIGLGLVAGAGYGIFGPAQDVSTDVMAGLASALSASGIFSGVSAFVQAKSTSTAPPSPVPAPTPAPADPVPAAPAAP